MPKWLLWIALVVLLALAYAMARIAVPLALCDYDDVECMRRWGASICDPDDIECLRRLLK